jgi:spermidine synthase
MKFSVRTPSGVEVVDSRDENVDVLIDVDDGRLYSATFFTIDNLRTLMTHYRETGECAHGVYFWAKDMIVVDSIGKDVIELVVADLISSGEIESCCTRLR